jgi:hypothetical protein
LLKYFCSIDMRLQHAAAVVGRRMVVVGGQTAYGPSNDVQVFIFDHESAKN